MFPCPRCACHFRPPTRTGFFACPHCGERIDMEAVGVSLTRSPDDTTRYVKTGVGVLIAVGAAVGAAAYAGYFDEEEKEEFAPTVQPVYGSNTF